MQRNHGSALEVVAGFAAQGGGCNRACWYQEGSDRTVVLMGFPVVLIHDLLQVICDSDLFACCLIQQGAAASQPLSVSIPPERSITPVLQDFMDPNLFYLPAYYYGGEEPGINIKVIICPRLFGCAEYLSKLFVAFNFLPVNLIIFAGSLFCLMSSSVIMLIEL